MKSSNGRSTRRSASHPTLARPLCRRRHRKCASSHSTEELIVFDAPMVARQEGAWEEMLETVAFKWMDAVVEERRGER